VRQSYHGAISSSIPAFPWRPRPLSIKTRMAVLRSRIDQGTGFEQRHGAQNSLPEPDSKAGLRRSGARYAARAAAAVSVLFGWTSKRPRAGLPLGQAAQSFFFFSFVIHRGGQTPGPKLSTRRTVFRMFFGAPGRKLIEVRQTHKAQFEPLGWCVRKPIVRRSRIAGEFRPRNEIPATLFSLRPLPSAGEVRPSEWPVWGVIGGARGPRNRLRVSIQGRPGNGPDEGERKKEEINRKIGESPAWVESGISQTGKIRRVMGPSPAITLNKTERRRRATQRPQSPAVW